MRVLVVAGARPNFVKIAPVIAELKARGDACRLVHTGQHYDAGMSDAFFADLQLPRPDYHLDVGSGTHAEQTARIMERFEPVLLQAHTDWLALVGDVNSTLACALVAAKLKEETGCRIAHIEAGLRSGDWRMPEEVNRVVTDRLSDLLLTHSPEAVTNLLREGIPGDHVRFVGNVMIDSLYAQLARARSADKPARLHLRRGGYALATVHRPSNVDDAEALCTLLEALNAVAQKLPVVLPIHPRTKARAAEAGLELLLDGLIVVPPLGYLDMLSMMDGAAVVLTDSGGVQEETTALGVPCVTLREQTERPITITVGTNRLAPFPLTSAGVVETVEAALAMGRVNPGTRSPAGWDGRAAHRAVVAMAHYDQRFPKRTAAAVTATMTERVSQLAVRTSAIVSTHRTTRA